jgi:hypothetical protein
MSPVPFRRSGRRAAPLAAAAVLSLLTMPAGAQPARGSAAGAASPGAAAPSAPAQPPAPPAPEFFRVRVDEMRNRALLDIPAAWMGKDVLHQVTLATGMGNGALDRAQTGPSGIVRFERRGPRVLLVRDNWSVRAPGGDAANQRAAAEAFPRSVSGSFPVEREGEGYVTVDATSLFLADAYGVADGLRQGGGAGGSGAAPGFAAAGGVGTYRVDAARSWIDGARTKTYPRNAEVHAVLTFVTDNAAGGRRGGGGPDPKALTFEEHHALVQLPGDGFRPRAYDPRFGYGGTQFADLSQGFDGTYRGGFLNRWRLVPRDTAAYLRGELVEPVTPITYYLDPGIPAPYREALREGGNWWAKAFEAAGFRNAFRVLDLPAGADPMDARYNMLMWIHRNGPGPSVGPSYGDPRTGEIVRAVVRMDAWRSLVDYNIYAGAVPAAGAGGPNVAPEPFAMMRRRQHAAHEIGHTLGLSHNYIASSQGRSSVMDYPFPVITPAKDGGLDFRDAWRNGPGAWDTLAIRLGYTWYPDAASERAGLDRILRDGNARNVRFINDTYAGPEGSIPQVTRWDEGTTMFDAVERSAEVRRRMMAAFDERAIQPGEPLALLNMRFTHVYLHHRYSLEAVSKYVGGMDFTFALRGDGQVPTRVLPAAEQRRALAMALDALAPAELAVPEKVQALMVPPPPGFNNDMMWIDGAGGTAFDAITLAGGLANEVVGYLLHRERAARLVLQQARDAGQLSLDEVLTAVVRRTWGAPLPAAASHRAVQRASQRAALDVMLDLAGDRQALPDVRAQVQAQLRALDARLAAPLSADPAARAHAAAARRDIARLLAGEDVPAERPRYRVITLPWP